ncbi:MAG: hypothetical protein JW751_11740 [Polyangiaceae bacterium]|nr:hypothetical protein [Polyangiaceae bacterium]
MGFTTEWRGQRDTQLRAFSMLIMASLALHAPMTPLFLLLGLLGLLAPLHSPPPNDLNELTAIPIDLLDDEGDSSELASGTRVAEPEPAAAIVEVPRPPQPASHLRDGGVEPEDAGLDADAESAVTDGGGDAGDAGEEGDAGDADAGRPTYVRDPVAVAAKDSKVVDSNANVQLTIYSENIRSHPLGPRLGRLMANLPQWNDFFGSSTLDPVASIDRIMLVGPDLADSSGLVVLIQHQLPMTEVRAVVDTLHGEWLKGPVPAALANADHADRVFVMPSTNMVVIAPPTIRDAALSFPRTARVPEPQGGEAMYGALKAPGYAFEKVGAPLRIPSTVSVLRFWAEPLGDGGGVGRFVAVDGSPEDAQRTMESLRAQVETLKVTGGTLGFLGIFSGGSKGLDKKDIQIFLAVLFGLELSVHGSEVHGRVTVPQRVIEELMARIERLFRVPVPRPARPAAAGSGATAPVGTARAATVPSSAQKPTNPEPLHPSD